MANAECRISFIRSMANGHICNMHKLVCFTLNTFPLRPATNAMLILRFKSKTNIQLTLLLSTLMFNVQACSEFQDPRFKSAYSIMFPFCSFYLLCSRMCLLTVQKCVVVISNTFYKCNLDLLIFSRFFLLLLVGFLSMKLLSLHVRSYPDIHMCNSITPIVS